MVFLNGTLLLGLISCCLAVPHRNVGRATTSLIPTSSLSAPTGTPTKAPKIDQKRYSNHVNDFYKLYGWLKPGTSVPDSDLPEAIRKIQAKLKEPVTGEFSEKMLAMMEGPRCGTEQQYVGTGTGEGQESKERYALWGPKWAKTTLTWRIDRYTNDLSQERQLSTIGSAFAQWMNSAPLNIVQAASNVKADINIRFLPINSNRTVAVTMIDSDGVYFTPGKINITFNDNEQWTDDILFSTTAVHEIGHALGLSHSTVPSAIMFAYYDGLMHPIHPDDKMGIHSIYGWKTPKWKLIDSGSKISSIIQVTSSSSTPAPNDGLYQMRPTGQILRYINNAWITIDNYKETAQITGANGLLYQRHYDGGTFRWTGTPSNWQSISPTDTSILDIHAASDQLYARRKDGSVVRLSGSTWLTIDQSSPGSRQIAVSDDKTLWNLLSNGDLVRSRWPYTSAAILDRNAANTGIAVGGNEFFKVQSDGAVVWLDTKGPYWSVIEQKASVGIHAVGELLYSRHADGTLWRWTGIPGVWEGIDERGGVEDVTGDRAGGVWGVLGGSEVWMHVS